jgi:hypothetical protein
VRGRKWKERWFCGCVAREEKIKQREKVTDGKKQKGKGEKERERERGKERKEREREKF